jgi:hypothetical protein
MRAPATPAAFLAGLTTACVVLGPLASACNALSGVNDFAVVSEGGSHGGADAGRTDGSTQGEGGSFQDVGKGPADASPEPSEAMTSDAELLDVTVDADGQTDASVAADGAIDAPNGCETSAPACDGGCPTMHSNGLGQSFYDCLPLGTITMAQAFEACLALTGDAGACANDPVTCGAGDQVCTTASSDCACWRYNGTNAGKVGRSGSATCACLGSSAPAWN